MQSQLLPSSRTSNPREEIQLTLLGVVARNDEPGEVPIPGHTAWSEALGAVAILLGIPQDVVVAVPAVRCGDGLVTALGVGREGDDHDLVPRGHLAVPGAVEGHEEVLALRVELGVEGSRVRLDGEAGRSGELGAGGVGEGVVGGREELGADGGLTVGELLAAPDGEAGWVSVPVLVGDGGVAD